MLHLTFNPFMPWRFSFFFFVDCDWHFHTRNWLSLSFSLFFPFFFSFLVSFYFLLIGIKNCGCFRLSWNMPWGMGKSFRCSSGSVLCRLHWAINCSCFTSFHSLPAGKISCCLVWTKSGFISMQHRSFW